MSKYKFFNHPREFGTEDYKESLKYIIKKYSSIKDLVSIYEWGGANVPGISDIDIVFVFKSNANSPLPFFKRSFYFINDKIRYLARHPFFFIDEDSFRDIKYINTNSEFKLLFGKNIPIRTISAKDAYFSDICLMNDIIIRHYPRDFLAQLLNKKINVRDTLLRLNSLKYSVKIVENLTGKKYASWNTIVKQTERLRKDWFKSKRFDSLVALHEEAVKITVEITEVFRELLIKKGIVNISSGDNIKYNGIKNKSLFIRNWDKKKALENISKIRGYDQKSILPIELSAQVIEYSKYKGKISSYIKKNMDDEINYQLKHKNIIQKRIDILNKQAELAIKLKHSDFVAFFDFGYTNKSGVNNIILNLLGKVRH